MSALTLVKSPVTPLPVIGTPCSRRCRTQCDECHTLENCVPATLRLDDLLLCAPCYRLLDPAFRYR